MNQIVIKGAYENNLKGIDLTIPRNKIVCFVGVSGSGKSTIAFDIIAREGQRQYFESLSSLARRYLAKSNRPEVEEIKGISSTIVISQDRMHPSPRSTVGTVTETYTYLRLLFSRAGFPIYDSSYFSFNHPLGACPKCKGLGKAVEVNINKILDVSKSLNEGALIPKEWYVGGRQWSIIKASGYFDMDKKVADFMPDELDRLLNSPPEMLSDTSQGLVNRWTYQGMVYRITHRNTKVHRGPSESDMKYFDFVDCPECKGGRLKKASLEVRINGKNIGEVGNMPISEAVKWVAGVDHRNAVVIKPRLLEQLQFLDEAGVGYLALNRSTNTLSGGEAQRVKLARQLGCDLIETIYVMDEPTAGLHPRDLEMVVKNLKRLRDSGNSVLVVEHDEKIIREADYVVEVGPGGGKKGGEIVFAGGQKEFVKSNCLTAKYMKLDTRNKKPVSRRAQQEIRAKRQKIKEEYLKIENCQRHNLKNISVDIPMGVMVALTGVSGAGKSSLVEEIMAQHPEKVVSVGQGAIGTNRRGCIGTYVGVFDEIRSLFAKENKVSASMFSFNSKVGQCPECRGLGFLKMDMNFLGDVKIKCDKCLGKRYKAEVESLKLQDKSISEVLEMTAIEASEFFKEESIKRGLKMLLDVGLDYLELGQTLDTLSGGEAQRLKLASRLQSRGDFYILDEPTSGLHFADVEKLMKLLSQLVDNGNTVLVIEHNLEVIRQADWIIDMGPEGGEGGGEVVAQGTVADIKRCPRSWTGKYL
ncbi:MAG: excinuclease ABC subunit UvrA [Candidatus Shapirobacteria bacterium]